MTLKSINPVTKKVMKEFKTLSFNDVANEIKKLRNNLQKWKDIPVTKRVEYIKKVHDILLKDKQKYAEIIVKEVGRPIKHAIPEIEKCASLCKYYVDNAEKILADQIVKTEAYKSYVRFEPLGVILGIMPWNYPFWQSFRWLIPSLTAGNICVMKHASSVPQCALAIEEIAHKAGLKDYFKTLLIDSETASKIIETDLIEGVSLTGSTGAGKAIGELAGRNLKKMVLELGGSDAFIVLDDADVNFACKEATESRFLNSGQSCNAAKRFIVVQKVAKQFEDKLLDYVKNLKIGDPMDSATDIGPLANKNMLENAERQVKDAIAKGAKILYGGHTLQKGYYFMPTVITNIKKNMLVANEETFGPIATIIVVKDEKEAIEEANRSIYGLGASIWTKNIKHAEELIKRIEAGSVYVNKKVRSDPRLPFGGIKNSGIGRELGEYGLKEFVNIKSIIIEK